jgi:uncharacterized protein (DUF1330 family)
LTRPVAFPSSPVLKNQEENEMPAYIVFSRERVRDAAAMETYSGFAAQSLAIYGHCETLEGPPLETAVIMEFPTFESAKAWYDSPKYKEAREHRFRGADYRVFIVQGL